MKQTYTVQGMHCSSCVMNIEEALLDIPGISDAEASLRNSKVTIEHDGSVDDAAVRKTVVQAGYELVGVG